MSFYRPRSLFAPIVFVILAGGFRPVEAQTAAPAPLTAAQIVDQMQRHNQERTEKLKDLQSIRHYQVEYRGFSKVIDAKMEVEYHYDAAFGEELSHRNAERVEDALREGAETGGGE